MTEWLINLFTWMNDAITGNFGLTIVLFTLLLWISIPVKGSVITPGK